MIKINLSNIKHFKKIIVEATGGEEGILNEGLLISALESPYQTFEGEDLNKTDIEKIVAIVYSLNKNHGFKDANKE